MFLEVARANWSIFGIPTSEAWFPSSYIVFNYFIFIFINWQLERNIFQEISYKAVYMYKNLRTSVSCCPDVHAAILPLQISYAHMNMLLWNDCPGTPGGLPWELLLKLAIAQDEVLFVTII